MGALYNEIEPYAGEWLRNLVAAGHIAAGAVDGRSITDLRAADVRGVQQAHFFAGIGVWSHALRLAGWPDDREVWTGSCPCQPFSVAGRGKGIEDERHLWPEWFRLIRECRPPVVFGEQVARIPCRDGKARPVEPGTFPLAHGAPARVGRLRAYGNAIVGPLAAEFVATVMEILAVEQIEG